MWTLEGHQAALDVHLRMCASRQHVQANQQQAAGVQLHR